MTRKQIKLFKHRHEDKHESQRNGTNTECCIFLTFFKSKGLRIIIDRNSRVNNISRISTENKKMIVIILIKDEIQT